MQHWNLTRPHFMLTLHLMLKKMIVVQPKNITVAKLNPTDTNKAIQVRVYRKWTAA